MKKFLAILLAVMMVLSMVACAKDTKTDTPSEEPNEPAVENPEEPGTEEPTEGEEPGEPAETNVVYAEQKSLTDINNSTYGTDYVSLYSQFGKETSIADVIEDETTGMAYIDRDGVRYELGLDFLSMAMVYNCAVPDGGWWETEDDVYANWWKLYIQRWNYLLPEVPLYSNEYYDVYNAEIKGVDEYPTNPYWDPASALIDWTSEKAENNIILGNSTELSGLFRYATFGGTNPGASDLDVQYMTVGLETVSATKEGGYEWNDTVVKEHSETENEDGSLTYTITIYDDMQFSDGSPVTARDYIAFTMVFASPVHVQAAGKDHKSGMQLVGYENFTAYDGSNDGQVVLDENGNPKTNSAGEEIVASKTFSGIRLLDDYTFSITVDPEYLPYFYSVTYASFFAQYRAMWIGDAEIMDDGDGVYLTDSFYAKTGDSYDMAALILETANNTDETYPYSGPYVVKSYDNADKSVILELNPYFKGNYEGATPSIGQVVIKRVISSTQLEDFKAGGVDVLTGITGGDATNEAIAYCDANPDKAVYTHYSRAGYGKLAFRADYGPAQFTEVRQAIAYCMDRAQFAKDFTGGYGGVVDGPYYTGSWMYKSAVEQGMLLNAYATSVDSAIAVLEEGGWIYDAEGNDYVEGVRYKKIPADEAEVNDINYQSQDGAYKTTKVGDDYYMPLVLNWYGTTDNEFSDQLVTGLQNNNNIAAAGIVVQSTFGDFSPMLDELYQQAVFGYYSGSPMYALFNFATGFTSAVYDYSWYNTIDPSMYDDYSNYYIKDLADAYWIS